MRAIPKSHIKLHLKCFYVGLSLSHRRVLDPMFENDFLGNSAFDTYDKMKNIFGSTKVETIEPTILVCFRQTELIKETKAIMKTNFKWLYNMSTKINGNIVMQNKRFDTTDQKIEALSILKDEMKSLNNKFEQLVLDLKDDNT